MKGTAARRTKNLMRRMMMRAEQVFLISKTEIYEKRVITKKKMYCRKWKGKLDAY
jgi:hypothetical protein